MDQKSITGEGFFFYGFQHCIQYPVYQNFPISLKGPALVVLILSWCVNEPHSYAQENSTRLCGFNYPERPSCPSNTADLPAGSLLPSIPNKPEIAVPLIRSGRKSKKRPPHFSTRYQIRKRMVSRRGTEQSERNSRREQNGSHHQSNKKRLTGNSRQPFKPYHFKIVSCLYPMSSNAVPSAL